MKFKAIFFAVYCCVTVVVSCFGATDTYVIWSDDFTAPYVDINESMFLENRGNVWGDINLCDYCRLYIRNNGVISGQITGGRQVTQIIQSDADVTQLNVAGGYSIIVQGRAGINLGDVMRIANGADTIRLEDTSITLSLDEPWQPMRRAIAEPKLVLSGMIEILIDTATAFDGMVLLRDVVVDGRATVYVGADNLVLHTPIAVEENNSFYLKLVRDTDYGKILGNSRGRFLNDLRSADAGNKTLGALDLAETLDQIDDIISRSANLNPIMLLRPISVINKMNTVWPDVSESGADASYIVSKDFSAQMISATAGLYSNEFSVSISAYTGELENSNTINDFSGYFYGLKLDARASLKSMWIHSTVVYTISQFKDFVAFDGYGSSENPTGKSFYGGVNLGCDFKFSDEFYTMPFIGVAVSKDKILHQSDDDLFGRIGASFGYRYKVAGMEYDYKLITLVDTDGAYIAGVSMDFMSIVDGAGIDLSYIMMRDEFTMSHKFIAGFKLRF